ncbi:hypothetical protein [Candidatus Electrothrix sp.]|uniref:hypothetical protein n=1 Tax=Candidatus Electrothrix sp. TaxID=2170559 RepID=UPI004057A506
MKTRLEKVYERHFCHTDFKKLAVFDLFLRDQYFAKSFRNLFFTVFNHYKMLRCFGSGIADVYNSLSSMGKFIGIDWFSTQYSDYRHGGKQTEDVYTRTGYTEGSFSNLGRVHFSDKKHLLELFKKFNMLVMEHKTVKRELPDNDWNFASWNFVAQKYEESSCCCRSSR